MSHTINRDYESYSDESYFVLSGDTKVGRIIKLFGAGNISKRKDADEFEVHFPVDIDVRIKCAAIATVFLIVSTSAVVFSYYLYYY